jgi:glycosyltransferase involved in cell wall biosynthesis
MIKVAHVVTVYSSVVTILDSKLKGLNKFDDLDVTIISSPPNRNETRSPAVRHITVDMARDIRPVVDLRSIWQLFRVLRQDKFDIVHSHTTKAGFLSAMAARMAGVQLVLYTYHGLPFFEGQSRLVYKSYYFLEKIACKFRDHVFAQSKQDLAECVKLIGSDKKASFEGNGIDIEYVIQSAREQLPEALQDFPGRGLRLVILSRLEKVKHVEHFFRVVNSLREQGTEVSCVVAGEGGLEKELKSMLAELKLGSCVNMVGFSSKPHGLIAASDIVMLCSEKEGIPRSVMEAMALQKPVVATDVSGTWELVENRKTGFLTPPGHIEAMVEKVLLLARDQELRERMGEAGLRRVSEHFNDIKIAEFLLDFYRRAVNPGEAEHV